MGRVGKWNERERDTCDLCGATDMTPHLWRVYVGRDWNPFTIVMCGGCHFASAEHEDTDNIMFGIGLEVLDVLRRRLPEPHFSRALGLKPAPIALAKRTCEAETDDSTAQARDPQDNH